MPRPHKPTSYEIELGRKIHELQVKLLRTNAELKIKTTYTQRLKILLHQRCEHIDQLNSKIEQLRDQNRRLDAEANLLIAMIQLTPDNTPLGKHA